MTASEVAKIAATANDARIKRTIQSAKLTPSLQKAIADLSKTATIKGTIPQITASPTTKGALAEALANIKPATIPKVEGTIQSAKLTPSLQKAIADLSKTATIKGTIPQITASPTTKGALAEALANIKPATIPKVEGTIQSAKLTPPIGPAASLVVAEPVKLEAVPFNQEPAAWAVAEPLPAEALAEAVAGAHAREDREAAIELLAVLGLDDATEHLYEIESCLLRGRKPARLHAALSASVLLRDLSDRLFPARDEPWVSRSGRRHDVGHEHVKNRLSAFVDARLRSILDPKEHQLFQCTLDVVADWTGKGHHVAADSRQAAKAFRQLLEVLATIARAQRSVDRHDAC